MVNQQDLVMQVLSGDVPVSETLHDAEAVSSNLDGQIQEIALSSS